MSLADSQSEYPALALLRSLERSKKGEGRKGKGKDARYFIEESTDVLMNKHCFICSAEGHELRECPHKNRKFEFEREVRTLYDEALAEWREANGMTSRRRNGTAAWAAGAAPAAHDGYDMGPAPDEE